MPFNNWNTIFRLFSRQCFSTNANFVLNIYLLFSIEYFVLVNASANFHVNDDTPPGRLIGTIDSLTGDPATKYSLIKDHLNRKSYFRVDRKTGKLYANRTLDREEICRSPSPSLNSQLCKVVLNVAIFHGGIPTITEITIDIFDSNDHIPVFPHRKQTIEIKESATINSLFALPQAVDSDSLKYSIQTYTTEPSLPVEFQLVQSYKATSQSHQFISAIYLKLKEQLDRENRDKYKFILKAIDGGSPKQTGSMTIEIVVLDENDNGPRFLNSTYRASVEESRRITQPIIYLKAVDPDLGHNARVRYDFASTVDPEVKNYFDLNHEDGTLRLQTMLDYEEHKQFRFNVIASNVGYHAVATATVIIQVKDLNDEIPSVLIDYLRPESHTDFAEIKENVDSHVFVAVLKVKDRDTGKNGNVVCNLGSQYEGYFSIKETHRQDQMVDYRVETKKRLDQEQTEMIRLKIQCTDHGQPPRTTIKLLNVKVLDENDHNPRLSLIGTPEIRENRPPFSHVATVKAIDPDSGNNGIVTFSMTSSKPETLDLFKIDSNTGAIETLVVLDRERTSSATDEFPVVVTACDKGEPPRSTTLSFAIRILDENDNAPTFKMTHMFMTVPENMPPNTQVGEIEIEDRDNYPYENAAHSTLTLRKRSLHGVVPFRIHKMHGKFYVNTTRSLDRESENEYTFQVIAVDSRGSTTYSVTGTVTVSVENENDNSPKIIFPQIANKTFPLSYRECKYYELLTVNANDADQRDPKAKDTISSDGGDYFFELRSEIDFLEIDPNSGTIRVHREMTSKDMGRHLVTVIVRDSGNQPRETSTQLIIEVDDSSPKKSPSSSELDFQHRNGARNNSTIWTGDTILVLVLIMVLLLLLGTVLLFIYVRHWRGSASVELVPDCSALLCFCCFEDTDDTRTNRLGREMATEKIGQRPKGTVHHLGRGLQSHDDREDDNPLNGKRCTIDNRQTAYKSCVSNPLDYPQKTMRTLSCRNFNRKNIEYETVAGLGTPEHQTFTKVYHDLDLTGIPTDRDHIRSEASGASSTVQSHEFSKQLGYDQLYFSPPYTSARYAPPHSTSKQHSATIAFTRFPPISVSSASNVSSSNAHTAYQTLGPSPTTATTTASGGSPSASKFSSSPKSRRTAFHSPLLLRNHQQQDEMVRGKEEMPLVGHRYSSDSNLAVHSSQKEEGPRVKAEAWGGQNSSEAENFLLTEQYKVQQKSMYMYTKSFPQTQASYV